MNFLNLYDEELMMKLVSKIYFENIALVKNKQHKIMLEKKTKTIYKNMCKRFFAQ
jgi:hypothetical protein